MYSGVPMSVICGAMPRARAALTSVSSFDQSYAPFARLWP
jgi:hypothetical protein